MVFFVSLSTRFYPWPVLAFGIVIACVCLSVRVCVCLFVCQSLVCPRDNSGLVQARITKFGPKMQKDLEVPIVLWTDRPWPSRSNWTSKSKFIPSLAAPHYNSPPIQARITKFGPEVQDTLVKIPIDCFTVSACCTYIDLGSRGYFGVNVALVYHVPDIVSSWNF